MAFERTPEKYLVEVPDEEHMGPAMKRLNERQRRFVCALGVYGGNGTRAYMFAGFEAKAEGSAAVGAHRLLAKDYIKDAIREEAERRMDWSTLLVVSGLIELAMPENTDKSSRMKALLALADRNGFHAKSEHLIIHEDRRTTKEIINSIAQIAVRNGLDPKQLLGSAMPAPDIVDAQFEEVPAGADGIEDLL